MNIQLPLAGMLSQQTTSGAGITTEAATNGDSFASILNQVAQPNQATLSALKAGATATVLPPQAVALKAILDNGGQLSAELLIEGLESEVPAAELEIAASAEDAEAIVNHALALPLAPVANEQVNAQAANTAAQVANVDVKHHTPVTPELAAAVRAATAQPQGQSPLAAQPLTAEASPELAMDRVEMAVAKPIATSNLEFSSVLASAGNQTLSEGSAARPVLTAPLASPQWQNDLSQQVSSFVMRGDGRVSLQLNPAELGPLLIEMKIVEQNAQLQFVSGQAAVRSAVEQAIPQLRDALAEQGIDLADVNVGEHSRPQGESEFAQGDPALNQAEADAETAELALNEATTEGSSVPGQLSVYA